VILIITLSELDRNRITIFELFSILNKKNYIITNDYNFW